MRRLPNLLTALSLLLCVALCVLWARCWWITDRFVYQGVAKLYSAVVHTGTLQLVHVDRRRDEGSWPDGFAHSANPTRVGERWWTNWNKPVTIRRTLGFGIMRGTYYRVVAM